MQFRAILLTVLLLAPRIEARAQEQEAFTSVTGTFPIEEAAGKRIKLTGYIMTDGVRSGFAGLWWRADKGTRQVAFDNMYDRGAAGTTKWRRYQLELSMPKDITNINFGMLLGGVGTAWFADLKIEVDGQPYSSDQFDLGLTSSPPRGFSFRGGDGSRFFDYAVDSLKPYQGKPSFRIRRIR